MKKIFLFLGLVLVVLLVSPVAQSQPSQEIKSELYYRMYAFQFNEEIGDRRALSVELLDTGANIVKLGDREVFIYVLEPSSPDVLSKVKEAIRKHFSH